MATFLVVGLAVFSLRTCYLIGWHCGYNSREEVEKLLMEKAELMAERIQLLETKISLLGAKDGQ